MVGDHYDGDNFKLKFMLLNKLLYSSEEVAIYRV